MTAQLRDPFRPAARPPVRGRALRSRAGLISLRVQPRAVVVSTLLVLAILGIGAVSLTVGDYPASFGDVAATLTGSGPPGLDFIVNQLRLPRWVVGLLVGGALGASGAILQSLTRNPLGSPDLIGFTAGASAGAVLVILVVGGGPFEVAGGAVIGAAVTAAAIYGLAYRRGVQGFRLILIGIGVSAVMLSIIQYLITRAELTSAVAAKVWLVGSLNGRTWGQVAPVALALLVLIPVALALSRNLSMLEMGDDAARARGVQVERSRTALVLISVALAGVATASAGPIGFVALAAPQLARRLTRSAGPGLLPATLMGSALLTGSDFAAQRVFAPTLLPVGIGTAALGGVYLAWLLAHEWRRQG